MADNVSRSDRSMNMSKIRSKNTGIELTVRKWLFARGYRYRIDDKKLPGKPDIVLKKIKCVIFVNGCFWHGHNCKNGHLPKSNIPFWEKKISGNTERDKHNLELLRNYGLNVIIIWECELKDVDATMIKVNDQILSYHPDNKNMGPDSM